MYVASINKANRTIKLGIQGENNARSTPYDISDWVKEFGDNGSVSLVCIRPGESVPYLASVEKAGNSVNWIVKSVDVEISGSGLAQYVYKVGDTVVKSQVFTTEIDKSIASSTGPITPPQQSFLEQIEALKDSAELAASNAVKAEKGSSGAAKRAESSASAASLSETNAGLSAQAAENSKAAAEKAKTDAQGSASAASQSELSASQHASSALESKNAVDKTKAAIDVTKGEIDSTVRGVREDAAAAKSDATNAQIAAEKALTSQNAAKLSENAAKGSEEKAKASETASALAQTGAETAQSESEKSKIAASDSAALSQASMNGAKQAETNSLENKKAAEMASQSAIRSATEASDSAKRAELAADRAENAGGGGGGQPVPGPAGENGGYYTPSVTQPDADHMQVGFTGSKSDMPSVPPVSVALPKSSGPANASELPAAVPYGLPPETAKNVQAVLDALDAKQPSNKLAVLTFTGAVEGTYDGTTPLTVNIPAGVGGTTPTKIVSITTDGVSTSFVEDLVFEDGARYYAMVACPASMGDPNGPQTLYLRIGDVGIFGNGIRVGPINTKAESILNNQMVFTFFVSDKKIYGESIVGVGDSTLNRVANTIANARIVKDKIDFFSQNSKPVPANIIVEVWKL